MTRHHLPLLATAIVLILALVVLAMCQSQRRTRDAQARAEAGQTLADARTNAATDASAIRDRADARDDNTASIVNQAERDIRNAPDSRAANRAALQRMCDLTGHRDPQCALLQPDPRDVAAGRR